MRRLHAIALATLAACGGTLYTSEGLPALPGGVDTCTGAGLYACSGTCLPEIASRCGPTCEVCATAIAGAAPICTSTHTCDFECTGGRLKSGAGCAAAASIAAGANHTCAVTTDGRLKCWGDNASGQVTGGASSPVALPHDLVASGVSTAQGAVALGASHTCAIVGGAIQCWGAAPALPATPPTGAIRLSAGDSHTCALHGTSVTCWGTPASIATVPALSNPTRIASGANHACALDGTSVRCWGATDQLQTGTGAAMFTVAPGVDLLAAGRNHSCAAYSAGTAGPFCWGDASLGQLGTVAADAATPVEPTRSGGGGGNPVINFNAAVISAGRSFTCVSKLAAPRNEDVKCFGGDNALGQLGGTPAAAGEAATAAGTLGTVALASGLDHSCALLDDGTLRCWGANGSGQLGSGTTAQPATGTLVAVSGR